MYFPIVIGICDVFMLLPISIGKYTVNTVQERHMLVPHFLRRRRAEDVLAFEGKLIETHSVFSYASAEVRRSIKTLRAVL